MESDSQHGGVEWFVPPGLELDLSTTYCRHVVKTNDTVALSNATAQGWDDDPAFKTHNIHCYHGTAINLNGELYGTLCFVSTDPHEESFSNEETMYAALIARLLAHELEQERFETQITCQSNLAVVLNRILRHNLRNDLSVVRGYTQVMAEQLGDDVVSDPPLRAIDGLLELSDKARELGRVVTENMDSEALDIPSLVEDQIELVGEEYPNAVFDLETDKRITTTVLPCFHKAIRELVENAAEHGGSPPQITAAISTTDTEIEVEISDNGSGLPAQEAKVFESGDETPLIHGSGLGLWLVYWIVAIHDGSTDVTATADGTTVTITLPRTTKTYRAYQQNTNLCQYDQYKQCFDTAGEGMTITNDDAKILDINDEAARIFGEEKQALIGRSVRDFLPAEFDFEAEWGDIQSAAVTRDTLPVLSADGGASSIEYTAQTDVVPGSHLIMSRDPDKRSNSTECLYSRCALCHSTGPL
ncbi:ATP-binding protein [Halonotius sp. GCM10025705]|uniref:ATP-binding protein n=1 Tax=Halonotius sp. GCM10025705 TaxID=3252678 RepID=UPI003613052A